MKVTARLFALLSSLVWPGSAQLALGEKRVGWTFVILPFMIISLLSVSRLITRVEAVKSAVIAIALIYSISLVLSIYACLKENVVRSLRSAMNAWGVALVAVLLAMSLFIYKPVLLGVQAYLVPTNSMEPALKPGDVILVDTWRYKVKTPAIGDVVVFESPESSITLVKRVAMSTGQDAESDLHRYFLLGDNKQFSRDSRNFGWVSTEQIRGRVTGVLFSFE